MDAAPTCSRLGCDDPAVAVFGFDARECLVWLDPLTGDGSGAGVLCTRHADRMSPPFGWNLLDRRGREARLWIGRPPPTPITTARRRDHAPRVRPRAPGPRLPFDAGPHEPEAPVRVTEPARAPWSPRDRPGPELEHVLDARTPLLARAFERARPADDAG